MHPGTKLSKLSFSGDNYEFATHRIQPSITMDNPYATYCRPQVSALMRAAKLDVVYKKAFAQYMYYADNQGVTHRVIDFVGGFGAALFGHNNSELKSVLLETIEKDAAFNAQLSCRAEAGRLAEKLYQIMQERFDEHFFTIFGNTGTEAAEIALKHAELFQTRRIKSRLANLNDQYAEYCSAYDAGELTISSSFIETFESVSGNPSGTKDLREMCEQIKNWNESVFRIRPYFLSLRRAFHGKSTGAVQLTYSEKYREPFTRIGPKVMFVKPEDHEDLLRAINECTTEFLEPELDSQGQLKLKTTPHTNISGMFIEPIQGEGGIHPLSKDYMQFCRKQATHEGFALILDEIQCGMGRTGTFLYSEQQEVIGDYYLLSKSLGGGYSKLSVVLVREQHYIADFDLMHSSTFAEDDYGCAVALRALELLTESKCIMEDVKEIGSYLQSSLEGLKQRFPSVIEAVRGIGLMQGLEFNIENTSSPLVACFIEQGMLGWVIAGYLLNKHKIRIAPALSNNRIIRFQPPACISKADCDDLLFALEDLCSILSRSNSYALTEYVIEDGLSTGINTKMAAKDYTKPRKVQAPVPEDVPHVAFIGHFAKPSDIAHWDRSLEGFTDQHAFQMLEKLYPLADLYTYSPIVVESRTGAKVCLHVLGIFADSAVVSAFLREKRPNIIYSKIEDAVRYAENIGCNMIGFGGYTSIITRNCKAIKSQHAGLTTGNALTVAMGIESIKAAAHKYDIDLSRCHFASVGAAGNIGQSYNEIISELVPRIELIGKIGSQHRLKRSAENIYHSIYRQISQLPEAELCGIAKTIIKTRTIQNMLAGNVEIKTTGVGAYIYQSINSELGEQAPITISTNIENLAKANVIVTASNAAEAIITPEQIKQRPAIICDIAVPRDTDPNQFIKHPDICVFQGGVVKLPRNPDFEVGGISLEPGTTFACLAETLLLGMENHNSHYSYGNISKEQVNNIMATAKHHGFELCRLKIEDSY